MSRWHRPAGLAGQEEIGRDYIAGIGPCGRWKERAVGARSFALHGRRRAQGVDDAMRLSPVGIPRRPGQGCQHGPQGECDEGAPNRPASQSETRRGPPKICRQEHGADRRHGDVQVEQPFVRPRGAQDEHAAPQQQPACEPSEPCERQTLQRPRATSQPQSGRGCKRQPQQRVRHDLDHVPEGRARRRDQPHGVQQQHRETGEEQRRQAARCGRQRTAGLLVAGSSSRSGHPAQALLFYELAPQNAAKRSSETPSHGEDGMGRNSEPERRFGALGVCAAGDLRHATGRRPTT